MAKGVSPMKTAGTSVRTGGAPVKRRGLTEKQGRFVEEFLVDGNASAAARRAGYSEKTARAIGNENLTKPAIREAIDKAREERTERTKLTADEVIEGLRREAAFTGKGSSHAARVAANSWLGRSLAMFTDKSQIELTREFKEYQEFKERMSEMSEDEVRELTEADGEEEITTHLVGRIGHV